MRRSIACQLSLVIAVAAGIAGTLTVAAPASAQAEFKKERPLYQAEFEKERRLYMLIRAELEDARAMERFYARKWKELREERERATEGYHRTLYASLDCFGNRDKTRKLPPNEWEALQRTCKLLEENYSKNVQRILMDIDLNATARGEQASRSLRLRDELNAAVANYVTRVALQAAILPPQPQVRHPPPGRHPPVRRRPPSEHPPKTDWYRELRGLGDRLGREQTFRRGF